MPLAKYGNIFRVKLFAYSATNDKKLRSGFYHINVANKKL